jgi:hypothetical protein
MADASKLKSRNRLGAPPAPEEASENLRAPEAAPVAQMPHVRRDARSMRRTHRTVSFATRVTPEFDNRIRNIAERDGLLLVEILERALDAYEQQSSS